MSIAGFAIERTLTYGPWQRQRAEQLSDTPGASYTPGNRTVEVPESLLPSLQEGFRVSLDPPVSCGKGVDDGSGTLLHRRKRPCRAPDWASARTEGGSPGSRKRDVRSGRSLADAFHAEIRLGEALTGTQLLGGARLFAGFLLDLVLCRAGRAGAEERLGPGAVEFPLPGARCEILREPVAFARQIGG